MTAAPPGCTAGSWRTAPHADTHLHPSQPGPACPLLAVPGGAAHELAHRQFFRQFQTFFRACLTAQCMLHLSTDQQLPHVCYRQRRALTHISIDFLYLTCLNLYPVCPALHSTRSTRLFYSSVPLPAYATCCH